MKFICHATTDANKTAIHFSSHGCLVAIKSIATVKRVSLRIMKNSGETSIAQAIIGFASSTPRETAYSVKITSTKLHD